MRLAPFLIATGLGQIPGTLLYVILGNDLIHLAEYQNRLWIIAGILIGLVLISKWFTRKNDNN